MKKVICHQNIKHKINVQVNLSEALHQHLEPL